MQEEFSVIRLIVMWLPVILFVATGWYIARQIRRGLFTKDGRSIADVSVELIAELKRMNGPAK
jgi:hypothetical protein